MVAFIGNTLRGKVSGENFDESIASRQNSSDFSPVKVLRYTVVVGSTFEEHLLRLREVFERFRDAGLKLKMSKCSFCQK